VELGPRLGIYVPVGFVVNEGAASVPSSYIKKLQVGAPLIGGQGLVWAKPWLGVEAFVALSPSMVAVTDSTGTADHASTVVLASTRVIVPITSRRGLWSFFLGAGVGVVSRSGSVWQYSSGTTARTWVLAFGGRTALTESLSMHFEFEDQFSTAQFDQGLATQTQPRSHQDVIFSVAVDIPVHHR